MHIAHVVCSGAFAGVERYVSTLAPRLAATGMRVSVIGGDPVAMRAALAGWSVAYASASSVGDALRTLHALGHVDLVNTHMSGADLAGILHRGFSRGPRIVSTRHFASRRGSSPIVRAAFGALGSRIDAQLSISRFVADAVEGRSTVVHTGVADADAAASAPRSRTVLVAQRLEPEKATDVAVRAWAASTAREHGWRLHIVGDGSQRAALETLAVELGAGASVQFLGYRTDVHALMRDAGVFLAPTGREGLGLSVLEAMAAALPVVASASGGHLETVGGADAPWLFDPGDAAGAASLLNGLIGDNARRIAYGERLQRRQRTEFTIGRQLGRTIELYDEVMAR